MATYNKTKNRGDILVFEDDLGGSAFYLFEKDLKKILAQYPSDLKFVVVASCHSENCGIVF